MDYRKFYIPHDGRHLVGDVIPGSATPDILCLHGAGTGNRSRFADVREELRMAGYPSAAFDYIGHGETEGELQGRTLKDRTEQALRVINELPMKTPLTIIASSMSGYTAIKLTETVPVNTLILWAPAIYDRAAYEAPFGHPFRGLIRKDKSWLNSDAWDILGRFKGKLLVSTGDRDETIPRDVFRLVYDSAKNALLKENYLVRGGPHVLSRYLHNNPAELKALTQEIIRFIKYANR